uniref:Uncharacterized protein n=1 Tax=Arundo donax TaxID=35708 RepID=A0A0A9TT92_ARUDO
MLLSIQAQPVWLYPVHNHPDVLAFFGTYIGFFMACFDKELSFRKSRHSSFIKR